MDTTHDTDDGLGCFRAMLLCLPFGLAIWTTAIAYLIWGIF